MPSGIFIRTENHRKKISNGLIGHVVSPETRMKISESKKGKTGGNKGKKFSKEWRDNISNGKKRNEDARGVL